MDKLSEMVKNQIEMRGIANPQVLAAMKKVKREAFVPGSVKQMSYLDAPLPIGHDQTISQPYVVAFMTEALKPEKNMKVLEIGTGSGYQTAVLAEIVKEVYSIEIVQDLHRWAKQALAEQQYENVHLKWGDGHLGWKEHAPYDRIIITAAPPKLPEVLIEQLAPEGLILYPEGHDHRTQKLYRLTKTSNGEIEKESLLDVRFVPMTRGSDQSVSEETKR